MKVKTVNDVGIKQIRLYLESYHELGGDHFTKEMLNAWATDVERSLCENDRAEFEIPSWQSKTGRTVLCRISDEGIDTSDFNETEEEEEEVVLLKVEIVKFIKTEPYRSVYMIRYNDTMDNSSTFVKDSQGENHWFSYRDAYAALKQII
jgi:hypothetical protein